MSPIAKPSVGPPPENAPKLHSRLLAIPQELRDEIYSWILCSTRITFGEMYGPEKFVKPVVKRSSPQPLALLYTCRQIHQEIGQRWIGWIVIKFLAPDLLLYTLTRLRGDTVAAIRHIETCNRTLQPGIDVSNRLYAPCWFMKMVPHLQLDTLTILGGRVSPGTKEPAMVDYDALDGFITYGTGWRELCYATSNSDMFDFEKAVYGSPFRHTPQPDTWRSALYRRDGVDSGASLSIYRSKTARPDSTHIPFERETFEPVVDPQKVEESSLEEYNALKAPSEKGKGVLVIVKRGRNADILEEFPIHHWKRDLRAFRAPWPWIWKNIGGSDANVDPNDEFADTYW